MSRRKLPIRALILSSFLMIVIISSGLMGLSAYYSSTNAVEEIGMQLSLEISHRVKDQTLSYIKIPHELNQNHADLFELGILRTNETNSLEKYFWKSIKYHKEISHTFFSNSEGDFIGSRSLGNNTFGTMLGDSTTAANKEYHYYSVDESGNRLELQLTRPKSDPRKRPWYTSAESSGTEVWSPIYPTIDTNSLAISASVPVYDKKGSLQGVIASNYTFNVINDFLASIEVGKTGEVYLIEKTGMIISSSTTHPNSISIDGQMTRIPVGEHASPIIRDSSEIIRQHYGSFSQITENKTLQKRINGDKYFLQVTQLNDNRGLEWIVVIAIPFSDFSHQIEDNNMYSLVIICISVLLVLLLSLMSSKLILSPIKKLNKMIQDIIEGHWDRRISTDRIDEIGQLGNSFDTMINYIETIMNTMPSLVVALDSEKRISLINSKAEKVFETSKSKAIGVPFNQIFTEIENKIEQVYSKRTKIKFKHNGKISSYEISILPLKSGMITGVLIIANDITEIVKINELLIQNEKMLSLGGLAAGMAHEINNPLGGILQTITVVERRLTDMSINSNIKAAKDIDIDMEIINKYVEARGLPEMFNTIKAAGHKASHIIENMLNFARKEDNLSSYQLTSIVDESIELISTDYDVKKHYDFKMIEICKDYQEDLPPFPCDRNKIQQVLINILKNGAQAMFNGHVKNPKIEISLQLHKQGESKSDSLIIKIQDNGPGIEENVRKRIFEPFYTTKPVGEGTGLGLSISYFIIKEIHQGSIWVNSTPEKGTEFTISLPVERMNKEEQFQK